MGDKISLPKFGSISKCPIHKKEYEGICIEKGCYESGLICPECSPNACNKTKKHKLISLQEFNEKYFILLKDSIDLQALGNLIKKFKEIDLAKLEIQTKEYSDWEKEIVKQKLDVLKSRLHLRLSTFIQRVSAKLSKIYEDFNQSKNEVEEIRGLVLPDFSAVEAARELQTLPENQLISFLRTTKGFMDTKKMNEEKKILENFLYGKYMYESLWSMTFEKDIEMMKNKIQEEAKKIRELIPAKKNKFKVFNNASNRFITDPNELVYKSTITNKSQKSFVIENVFDVYTDPYGKSYILTSNNVNYDIDCYNALDSKLEKSLKGHLNKLYMVRYFHKKNTDDDILLSSDEQKTLIIWNLHSFSIYKKLFNCHNTAHLYSALYYYDKNDCKDYIVTSSPEEYIKIWDYNTGSFVKEIGSRRSYTYSINITYFKGNYYIIDANSKNVSAYKMTSVDKLYREYKDTNEVWHITAFTDYLNNVLTLIESDGSSNGTVRLWNFETGLLLTKISCPGGQLRGICLWNNKYIIAASGNNYIKVLDLELKKEVKSMKEHIQSVCTVKKLKVPKFGECLISSSIDGTIKLFAKK